MVEGSVRDGGGEGTWWKGTSGQMGRECHNRRECHSVTAKGNAIAEGNVVEGNVMAEGKGTGKYHDDGREGTRRKGTSRQRTRMSQRRVH